MPHHIGNIEARRKEKTAQFMLRGWGCKELFCMLTYEDVTGYFLKTASDLGLTTHPEHWMNSHTLEREFACTCHTGNCEEAENHSACTISFTWSTLDTALSLE